MRHAVGCAVAMAVLAAMTPGHADDAIVTYARAREPARADAAP